MIFSAHTPVTGQMICAEKVAIVIQQRGCSGATMTLGPSVLLNNDRNIRTSQTWVSTAVLGGQ